MSHVYCLVLFARPGEHFESVFACQLPADLIS